MIKDGRLIVLPSSAKLGSSMDVFAESTGIPLPEVLLLILRFLTAYWPDCSSFASRLKDRTDLI